MSVLLIVVGLGISPALATALDIARDFPRRDWSRWRNPTRPDRLPYADHLGGWLSGAVLWWPVALIGYLADRRYAPTLTLHPLRRP